MEKLEAPAKRYLTGKLPTHSSSQTLASNFKALDPNALLYVFHGAGYLTEDYKPTKLAVDDGLIDSCEGKALWRLEAVQERLRELGTTVERQAVNQELTEPSDGEPRWVNLGTIGTYFNVTANTIGKWLDTLKLRDEDGMGNDEASEQGLCTVSEMNAGGKKTRKIAMWNLYPTARRLMEAGYELDFDYNKTLEASGKNGAVAVTSFDEKAKTFAREFAELFKDKNTRHRAAMLVKRTPKPILEKAETLLKKPGFLTEGTYLKYIR